MNPAPSTKCPMKISSIYVVDDVPLLTELYALILEGAGHIVTTFNDRARALRTLRIDQNKPDLIITDCLGHFIPVDQFIDRCHELHPSLRILLATGDCFEAARISGPRPVHYISKPFRPAELLREVNAVLTDNTFSGLHAFAHHENKS